MRVFFLVCSFGLNSVNQDEIIAKGDAFYNSGKYNLALKEYKKANRIDVFEVPKVYLFPRLALTYLKLNQIPEAKELISKAYIVANIQHGLILCKEDPYRLEWKNGTLVSGKIPNAVEKDFCGLGYEYLYKIDTLEGYALSAQYLIEYINASKEFTAAGIKLPNFK